MINVIPADRVAGAWLCGLKHLLAAEEHSDFNLILDIQQPAVVGPQDKAVIAEVDKLLRDHDLGGIGTVANTIFPAGPYLRAGAKGVYEEYPEVIFPRISGDPGNWWGTYAYRLVRRTNAEGKIVNPLERTVNRIRREAKNPGPTKAHPEFELNLSDEFLDISIADPSMKGHNKRYGGPCLSHLSFKLIGRKKVALVAFYRSHYYVHRALGNLVGLTQLLQFVAAETSLEVGPLTCISSYAQADSKHWGMHKVRELSMRCEAILPTDR